jgi:hypothetical protein
MFITTLSSPFITGFTGHGKPSPPAPPDPAARQPAPSHHPASHHPKAQPLRPRCNLRSKGTKMTEGCHCALPTESPPDKAAARAGHVWARRGSSDSTDTGGHSQQLLRPRSHIHHRLGRTTLSHLSNRSGKYIWSKSCRLMEHTPFLSCHKNVKLHSIVMCRE